MDSGAQNSERVDGHRQRWGVEGEMTTEVKNYYLSTIIGSGGGWWAK